MVLVGNVENSRPGLPLGLVILKSLSVVGSDRCEFAPPPQHTHTLSLSLDVPHSRLAMWLDRSIALVLSSLRSSNALCLDLERERERQSGRARVCVISGGDRENERERARARVCV